jgi:hypothetical protein
MSILPNRKLVVLQRYAQLKNATGDRLHHAMREIRIPVEGYEHKKHLRVRRFGTKVMVDSMRRRCRKQHACVTYKEKVLFFSVSHQCFDSWML